MTPLEIINLMIAVLGLIVTVLGTTFAYRQLYPARREVIHGVETKYRLLNAPDAAPDLEISWRSHRLQNPYVVEYSLVCSGQSAIVDKDFDENRQIAVNFSQDIVTDLTPTGNDSLKYRVDGRSVIIGPTTLDTGGKYFFTLLFDGDPALLASTVNNDLANVTMVDRAEYRKRLFRRRILFSYVVAAVFAGSGAAAALGAFGVANPLTGAILLASSLAPLSLGLILGARRI